MLVVSRLMVQLMPKALMFLWKHWTNCRAGLIQVNGRNWTPEALWFTTPSLPVETSRKVVIRYLPIPWLFTVMLLPRCAMSITSTSSLWVPRKWVVCMAMVTWRWWMVSANCISTTMVPTIIVWLRPWRLISIRNWPPDSKPITNWSMRPNLIIPMNIMKAICFIPISTQMTRGPMKCLIERVRKYQDHLLHMIVSLIKKKKIGLKEVEPILQMNRLRRVNIVWWMVQILSMKTRRLARKQNGSF